MEGTELSSGLANPYLRKRGQRPGSALGPLSAVNGYLSFANLFPVITCPLCQHQQARGLECDVCGRPFPEHLVAEVGQEALPVEPMPGLETTAVAPPEDTRAATGLDSRCNWCGHEQEGGRVCERCGRQRKRSDVPVPKSEEEEEEGLLVCGECGFKSPPPRCFNCGSMVKAPD